MNPKIIISKTKLRTQTIPSRYAPKYLTKKDRKKQLYSLQRSQKQYTKKKYYTRPKIKSFKSRRSNHLEHARKLYGVDDMAITPTLAKRTKCSAKTLRKIVKKGEGAYFSSGSRPNQTAQSWGYARLASALSGGNSSIVDYHLLESGCSPKSPALKLARRTCRSQGRKCGK